MQTIEEVDSQINGQIKVVKSWGKYSVWVGGFEQSGNFYVEKIWREKLSEIKRDIKSVLVLGFGCGTVAQIINKKWPKAKITGVEIDPIMVELAKKYFHPKAKIIIGDGRKFVRQKSERFDLILVDSYLGNRQVIMPDLSKIQAKNGIIITNHLKGFKNKLVIQY